MGDAAFKGMQNQLARRLCTRSWKSLLTTKTHGSRYLSQPWKRCYPTDTLILLLSFKAMHGNHFCATCSCTGCYLSIYFVPAAQVAGTAKERDIGASLSQGTRDITVRSRQIR